MYSKRMLFRVLRHAATFYRLTTALRRLPTIADTKSSHDPTPSILKYSLPERASSDEHQAKRHKVEGSAEPTTILTRLSSNLYSTIEEVLADIDLVVSDIAEKLELPNGGNLYQVPSPADTEKSLKLIAFKTRAHELVQRDKKGKEEKIMSGESAAKNLVAHMANGGIDSNIVTLVDANSGDNKLVLTLYGTAPTAKQLFSSFQLPAHVHGETKNIVQTLREAGLPNGITTTQIVPIQSTGLADDRKHVQTLGELFPTPPTVPALQPPKPSKIATTRSSTVGWYQPATADPPPRNGSYFKQPISTGQWLDYSNASPSPGTKRKQRDRALSLVGGVKPQLDVDSTESEAAKLDALFRSAYSGFAPCKDDAAAIVPGGMLDRIWFQNIGAKSFERLVQNASYLEDAVAPEVDQSITNDVDEEEKFREAVDNFEETIDPNLEPVVGKPADEKEVDEILEEISDLLRTLNSHQRNRHLNLNASGRSGGLLNAPDTKSLGTPSQPSEPEISIYEILKSQLTLMIASLPPYAVAKLDSDQLAELAISTKMEIRTDDYRGVMEEDEASARARAALSAATSASRPVQQPQHRPSSSALYGNQYAAARPAAPPQHQYYNSPAPIRPPSNNLQRPPATAQVPYPSQRPAPGAPYRPNPTSYGTPSYPQQPPRQQQQPYTPQYHQHGANQNYSRPAGQSYQGVPQSAPAAAMNQRYAGQSYPQQAPAQNGMDYRYGNGVNTARQVSPQKPLHSPQPMYNQAQARPGYGTPTPSMSQDRRPYLQNPMAPQMMNGGHAPSPQLQHTPQQQTGQTMGQTASGYSTFMSAEQQASMMERQRAQLAQQQGMQQTARNAAQAGMMGSPSKSQVNGNAVPAGL